MAISESKQRQGMARPFIIFNGLWFQCVWWVSILGGDRWLPLAFVLLVIHLVLVDDTKSEAKTLLYCAALGVCIDASLTLLGFFSFYPPMFTLIPIWLVFLWFGFAATLNHSLSFFADKLWLSCLCGGVFGALSYVAAARFDAVDFPEGTYLTFAVLAVVWAVLFPLCFKLAAFAHQNREKPKLL